MRNVDIVARVRDAFEHELARSGDRVGALGAAVGAIIAERPSMEPAEAVAVVSAMAARHSAPPWPRLHVLSETPEQHRAKESRDPSRYVSRRF